MVGTPGYCKENNAWTKGILGTVRQGRARFGEERATFWKWLLLFWAYRWCHCLSCWPSEYLVAPDVSSSVQVTLKSSPTKLPSLSLSDVANFYPILDFLSKLPTDYAKCLHWVFAWHEMAFPATQGRARPLSKWQELLLLQMNARRADSSSLPELQHQGSLHRPFHPVRALTFSDAMVSICNLFQETKPSSLLSLLSQLGWGRASLLKPMRKGLCSQICAQGTKPASQIQSWVTAVSCICISVCCAAAPALISEPLTSFEVGSTFRNHPYFPSFLFRNK